MAQVQALDSILACNRLRDLHAHRHRYRPWREAVVRAGISNDADRQWHLRLYLSRYLDLYWSGGAHGARVHVQRVHAAGAYQRGSGRCWDDGPWCGSYGAAWEVGLRSLAWWRRSLVDFVSSVHSGLTSDFVVYADRVVGKLIYLYTLLVM